MLKTLIPASAGHSPLLILLPLGRGSSKWLSGTTATVKGRELYSNRDLSLLNGLSDALVWSSCSWPHLRSALVAFTPHWTWVYGLTSLKAAFRTSPWQAFWGILIFVLGALLERGCGVQSWECRGTSLLTEGRAGPTWQLARTTMRCSATWHQISVSFALRISGQLFRNPPADATLWPPWDVTWVYLDHLEENGCLSLNQSLTQQGT